MGMIRFARFSLPVFLALGFAACHDNKTTTAPGALANVALNAPSSVSSGQGFTIDVSAVTVGVNNVHNASVSVTLPAPLTVSAADASSGTSASFASGSGATVTWTLGTLDSNSQARLHIQTMGVLPAGAGAMSLSVSATLTADGIHPGDAVANATIQLNP